MPSTAGVLEDGEAPQQAGSNMGVPAISLHPAASTAAPVNTSTGHRAKHCHDLRLAKI